MTTPTLKEGIAGIAIAAMYTARREGKDWPLEGIIESACYAAIRAFAEQEPSDAIMQAGIEACAPGWQDRGMPNVFHAMMQAALKELK